MERPFTLDHIDHVVLRVRDIEKSVAFYKMLGGDVAGPRPAGTAVRITEGQTVILQPTPDYVPAEVSALDHINLAIKGTSIEDVTDYLRANGATITQEAGVGPTGRVTSAIRVSDPDGHTIEIRIGPAR